MRNTGDSIVLQETNGGGAGSRETGRESADAVPSGRGSWQGSVPDDGVRASGWRASVQLGQQATVVGDGIDPSWGGPVGLPLRSTAASRRANLLKRDDESGESRQVNHCTIVFVILRSTKIRSERVGYQTRSFINLDLCTFLRLLHEISERWDTHSLIGRSSNDKVTIEEILFICFSRIVIRNVGHILEHRLSSALRYSGDNHEHERPNEHREIEHVYIALRTTYSRSLFSRSSRFCHIIITV